MINRTKLEHILEYARQQKRFGQHCKIPPGDMVEIVEIAMRKAGNPPVTPDGWISCSERMPSEEDVLVYCSDTKEQMVGFHKGKGLFQFFYMNGVEGVCEPSHWMPLPEPPL
ncbi:DUF551 domain-containing protein [Escherichia coli]|nr:DUF551 domain-containing protein [Escherichia coli]